MVKGRLERGRTRLRKQLGKHGLALPTIFGAGLLLASPAAVARPLVESTLALSLAESIPSAAVKALLSSPPRRLLPAALLCGTLAMGVGLLTLTRKDEPAQPPAEPSKPEAQKPPSGVVARLGIPRLPLHAPMAFAPDGRTFVGLSGDTVIRFDAETGKALDQQSIPEMNATLSADGRIALAATDTEIKAWEIATGRQTFRLQKQNPFFRGVLSPDGKTLAGIASTQGPNAIFRLSVWDIKTGVERVFEPTKAMWGRFVFSPDGKRLLVWSGGREMTCWDVGSAKIEWNSRTRGDDLLFAPDGKLIFGHELQKGWFAMDAGTGKPISGLKLPTESLYSAPAIAPDNRTFILPTKRGVVFWDMKEGRERSLLPGTDRNTATGSSFLGPIAPDGKSILTNFGAVQRYDLATGRPMLPDVTNLGHTASPSSLAFSRDGKWLASGSWEDLTIRIWETATGRLVHSLHGHTSYVRKIEFTPDGRRLVSGSGDSTVRVWEVATGRELRVLRLHDGRNQDEHQQVGSFRISPDGPRVTVTAVEGFRSGPVDDHVVSVWDIIDGKRLDQRRKLTLKSYEGVINRPLTADGHGILLDNGNLVDLVGTPLRPPPEIAANEYLVYSLFSADERLAAGKIVRRNDPSDQHTLLVWEFATGRPIVRLHVEWLQQWAFASPGSNLVTINRSEIQNWDLRTAKVVRSHPVGHTAARIWTKSLAVSPDGKTAATGHNDTTILLWDIAPPQSPAAPLTAADCTSAWADLAGTDAANAFTAVCRLADDPKQSLPFLKEKFQAIRPLSAAELKSLLADLESPDFKTREAAEKKLRSFSDLSEAPLRDALNASPSPEARKRIEAILANLSPAIAPQGEVLRGVRAIWALERIGTPEARKLLEELAAGDSRMAREAKAALERK